MAEYNLGHVVGIDGKGIQDISKTDTTDNIDTYTITYTNGDTQTFTVTNGRDASLTNSVTSGDTTHATTGKAVYDFVTNLIGNIENDMLR